MSEEVSLELLGVEADDALDADGARAVRLRTGDGTIDCRFHPAGGDGDLAVLWVFGAGGGLGGPAGGLYPRLAGRLAPRGLASLRLDYRRPNHLIDCVLDVLMGIAHLETLGLSRVILVGHSFGGAVAISAGAVSANAIGVAALSSQTSGTQLVERLSPRPLLLLHGSDDEILPDACSLDIHRRAGEPRRLILYPGCRHGLDQCRDALDRDLSTWIAEVAGIAAA